MNQHQNSIEKELLERVKNGNHAAFGTLFNLYYGQMVNKVLPMVPDKDTAEQIVQDAFVKVWNNLTVKNLAINFSFQAYLRRAVINTALNHLKETQRNPELFAEMDLENEAFQTDAMMTTIEIEGEEHASTLEDRLYSAIQELPPRCRMVFTLHKIEGYSHKEIAEELQISTKTIENQITKALKHLRDTLANYRNFVLLTLIFIFSLASIGDFFHSVVLLTNYFANGTSTILH